MQRADSSTCSKPRDLVMISWESYTVHRRCLPSTYVGIVRVLRCHLTSSVAAVDAGANMLVQSDLSLAIEEFARTADEAIMKAREVVLPPPLGPVILDQ